MDKKSTIETAPAGALEKVQTEKPEVCPFRVGESWFIRCVTYHCTGRVKAIVGRFLVLEEAAWIAESGRFSNAIQEGVKILSEVEPVDRMVVNLHAIVDAFPWNHPLPREQQ